jgi:8-oxo-dGTP pyrophosphatase MutT (NUDIX family)
MRLGTLSPHVAELRTDTSPISTGHAVVAVVIECRGKIALLKRSRNLDHDRGLWHCITGYLEPGVSPKQQALEEILEETGLSAANLLDLRAGPDLVINDDDSEPWLIHTFTAVTSRRRLEIDWEHDAYRWTAPDKVRRFVNRVSWLDQVLHATGFIPRSDTETESLSNV